LEYNQGFKNTGDILGKMRR